MRRKLLLGLFVLALLLAFSRLMAKNLDVFGSPVSAVESPDLSASFGHLRDSGSACFITLFVEKSWDPLSGHAFLQLTKTDGLDSVVRVIGFYRANPKQSLYSDQPVPAKIADDSYHPYHACLRRQISTAELQSALREIQHLSVSRYQTFHFNSVDFTLKVMAASPSAYPIVLTGRYETPGRLYRLLKRRQKEAKDSRETIGIAHSLRYAGGDHTPTPPLTIIHHS